MIRAVIFDCFGVLVGRGFWNTYREAGGDPAKDKDFLDDWLNQVSLGEASSEDMSMAMAGRLGISYKAWRQIVEQEERPNEDIFDFIKNDLRGKYKLAILSNANHGVVQRKIPPELLGLFDAVVVSAEVGLIKPDPAIFRLTAERLGVPPEQTVFTDDHQEYLDGASQIGMLTVLYKDLTSFRQEIRDIMPELEAPIQNN